MIELQLIKSTYAAMTDQQLLHLAGTEGNSLTEEALRLLQQEFEQRHLDAVVFDKIAQHKLDEEERRYNEQQDRDAEEFTASVWNHVLDEKAAGKSNEVINHTLVENGVEEEEAAAILNNVGTEARRRAEAASGDVILFGLVFFAGILITCWTMSHAIKGGRYIVAYGAVIFGGIRFFKALADKEKYKKVVKQMQPEEASESLI